MLGLDPHGFFIAQNVYHVNMLTFMVLVSNDEGSTFERRESCKEKKTGT
jgi:hypothetical protein